MIEDELDLYEDNYNALLDFFRNLDVPDGMEEFNRLSPSELDKIVFGEEEKQLGKDSIIMANLLNDNNKHKLMKKPSDEEIKNISGYLGAKSFSDLYTRKLYGKDMKNHCHHSGETTWSFPKGIKEKIEDDKKYLVYYDFHDSADSSDTSIHYKVYYIEEC